MPAARTTYPDVPLEFQDPSWTKAFENAYAQAVARFMKELPGQMLAPALEPVLRPYLLRPGKRIRPRLFCAGWRIFSQGQPTPAWLLQPATGLELFHNFVLIHDDLIDDALTRRGLPALSAAIADSLPETARQADSLALVCGDILYSQAVSCFCQPDIPAETQPGLRHRFLQMAAETGSGQALELINATRPMAQVSRDSILETYHLKTTRYTFEAPLQMGAAAAGASTRDIESIRVWTAPLGLAFQIENDLHEFRIPASGEKPALSTDLKAGMKTLLLQRFFSGEGQSRVSEWESMLAVKSLPADQAGELINAIRESAAFLELEDQVQELYEQARKLLRDASYPETVTGSLLALIEALQKLRHHSEARPLPG